MTLQKRHFLPRKANSSLMRCDFWSVPLTCPMMLPEMQFQSVRAVNKKQGVLRRSWITCRSSCIALVQPIRRDVWGWEYSTRHGSGQEKSCVWCLRHSQRVRVPSPFLWEAWIWVSLGLGLSGTWLSLWRVCRTKEGFLCSLAAAGLLFALCVLNDLCSD